MLLIFWFGGCEVVSIVRITSINMVALRILMEIKSEINAVCLITSINVANTIMDLKYCITQAYSFSLPLLSHLLQTEAHYVSLVAVTTRWQRSLLLTIISEVFSSNSTFLCKKTDFFHLVCLMCKEQGPHWFAATILKHLSISKIEE